STPPQPTPERPHVHNRGQIRFQPGAVEARVRGYLSSRDVDAYTFVAYAGQPAKIILSGNRGEVQLRLRSPQGNIISSPGETFWNGNLPYSGTYHLKIVAGNQPEGYSLSVEIDPN
ncbi:MAG: hypothetical protein AAGF24_10750, partial [Cyanobacteria bacterium P01_H01_bin.121]